MRNVNGQDTFLSLWPNVSRCLQGRICKVDTVGIINCWLELQWTPSNWTGSLYLFVVSNNRQSCGVQDFYTSPSKLCRCFKSLGFSLVSCEVVRIFLSSVFINFLVSISITEFPSLLSWQTYVALLQKIK